MDANMIHSICAENRLDLVTVLETYYHGLGEAAKECRKLPFHTEVDRVLRNNAVMGKISQAEGDFLQWINGLIRDFSPQKPIKVSDLPDAPPKPSTMGRTSKGVRRTRFRIS